MTVHINRTMWNTWSDKRGGNIWQHGLKHFTLMALMKRKNIYMKSSFLTFLLLGIQFFNHFNFYFCFCFLFSFFLISSIFFFFFFCLSQVSYLVLDTLLSLTFANYLLFFFNIFEYLFSLFIYSSLLLNSSLLVYIT